MQMPPAIIDFPACNRYVNQKNVNMNALPVNHYGARMEQTIISEQF